MTGAGARKATTCAWAGISDDSTGAGELERQAWAAALPEVVASGTALGPLAPGCAAALGLPGSCLVVAGSTDANAAVLAADPAPGDGVTVLGTTLVLKQFVAEPIEAPGLSCHRLGGRWLVGGASNAGGGVLRQFFSDAELERLSRQIDPSRPSGLHYRPLPSRGERFPVDDPDLLPILEPRPVSDALFLQGLLEGLARIEAQGWARLRSAGCTAAAAGDQPGGRGPQSPVASAATAGDRPAGAQPSGPDAGPGHGTAGPERPEGDRPNAEDGGACTPAREPMNERLRTVISMALFVVLAGYVGFSAIRLGLLLWQRFALV